MPQVVPSCNPGLSVGGFLVQVRVLARLTRISEMEGACKADFMRRRQLVVVTGRKLWTFCLLQRVPVETDFDEVEVFVHFDEAEGLRFYPLNL